MAPKPKKKTVPKVKTAWHLEEYEKCIIVQKVKDGVLRIREASRAYFISRNTLKSWRIAFSLPTPENDLSSEDVAAMPDRQQLKILSRQILELTRQLEQAKLKTASLETMIKVAEEKLKIKIRKKRGRRGPVPNSQKIRGRAIFTLAWRSFVDSLELLVRPIKMLFISMRLKFAYKKFRNRAQNIILLGSGKGIKRG